jgi:hypothetical protein
MSSAGPLKNLDLFTYFWANAAQLADFPSLSHLVNAQGMYNHFETAVEPSKLGWTGCGNAARPLLLQAPRDAIQSRIENKTAGHPLHR